MKNVQLDRLAPTANVYRQILTATGRSPSRPRCAFPGMLAGMARTDARPTASGAKAYLLAGVVAVLVALVLLLMDKVGTAAWMLLGGGTGLLLVGAAQLSSVRGLRPGSDAAARPRSPRRARSRDVG